MSEDWAPGDLALCVSVRHRCFEHASTFLSVGRIYTVDRVGQPISWADGERALGFSDVSPRDPNKGFPETLFRKLRPHTPDAEDEETIRLMGRQPVGESV